MTEMWICNDCDEEFVDNGERECPYCGSSDIEELSDEWEEDEF